MFVSQKISRLVLAALFLAATLTFATRLQAAETTALSGSVSDHSGSVVSGATITLFAPSSTIQKTRSDEYGQFTFPNLAPGRYLLECDAPGFQGQSQRISTAGGTETLEIVLEVAGLHQDVSVVASTLPELPTELSKVVSVISSEEIAARDLIFLSDALVSVPALQIQQLGGPGQLASFRFRGMRPEDTVILLDGFRFQDSSENKGSARPLLSTLLTPGTERIEVLRGAGSTLYGTNAIGGVVNVVSHQPTEPLSGWLAMEGGTLGLFQGSGGIEGLAARKRFSYSAEATHVNYTRGEDDNDAYRNTSGSLRTTYTIGSRAQLFAKFSLGDSFGFLNEDPSPVGNLAPLPPGQFVREAIAYPNAGATFYTQLDDPDNRGTTRYYSGATRLDYQLSSNWTQSLSYQALRTQRRYEDGPLLSPQAASLGILDFPNVLSYDSTLDEVLWLNSLELGRHDSLAFALGWNRTSFNQTAFGQTTQAAQRSFSFRVSNSRRLLDDRLQLQGSIQGEFYKLDAPKFGDATGNPYGSVSNLDVPSTFNGDGSVAYFFAGSGTKLRAHVGNGYRTPALYERFGSGGSGSYYGKPTLEPERTVFVDGGVDQFLARDKVQVSATYFYTHLQTFIDFGSTPSDPFGRFFGYLNLHGGNARGAEFSITARPLSLVEISGSYTYTNSDQVSPTSAGNTRLLGLSDHQFTLGISLTPVKKLSLHLQTYAVSDHDFPLFGSAFPFPFGTYRFPGYVRQDLSAGYVVMEGERARLSAVGRIDNLFNREYYQGGFLAPKATVRGGLKWEF